MNIHEHQAKQILKKYGVPVPEGIFALTVDELIEKAKSLKTEKFVLKAQIHAGGRGKAGGVKILNNSQAAVVGINTSSDSQESNMWILKLKKDMKIAKKTYKSNDILQNLRAIFKQEIIKKKIQMIFF